MVKSETRLDAEILVRNPSPRLFGEKFRDSKKVKANHEKTRLRDLSKTLQRFRDPAKIFRDPRFSRYHSATLTGNVEFPKFQTGMFVEWKAPQMYINLLCIIFSDNHYSAPSCDHFGRHGG